MREAEDRLKVETEVAASLRADLNRRIAAIRSS
jgi:hypothetical protein